MSPSPVVGLDLGGTKIDAALVGDGGAVLARHTLPTPAAAGAEAVLDALAEAAEAVRAPGTAAVGVAAAGVIDPGSGVVLSSTDAIRGWTGTALASGLAGRTGLPVACDNDVRAAAGTELGEDSGRRTGAGADGSAGCSADAVTGAGGSADAGAGAPADRGASRGPDVAGGEFGAHDAPLIYAAIGTGVGGAVAVAGRLLIGIASAAGHLGHLPSPEAEGLPCTCGGAGHLEAIGSGPAITAHYARIAGSPADRLQVVAARAAHGDAPAAAAIALGARAAGRVLGGLANSLAPYRVVVAGGVPRIGAAYWGPFREAFEAELIPSLTGLTPQPPRVGHDAAVLGAAALTRTQPLHQPHPTGATR